MSKCNALLVSVAAVILLSGTFARRAFSAPQAKPAVNSAGTPTMPLDEIRPGMKGIGKTVFVGSKIEDFQVEILGVLRNVTPGQNVILARIEGGPLQEAGVVAGMSGSPVYIDGRLIGAVALGFQFAKEPIGGITPIGDMLRALDDVPAVSKSPDVKAANSTWEFEPGADASQGPRLVSLGTPDFLPPIGNRGHDILWGGAESSLIPVATPLMLSGFTPEAIEQFAEPLRSLGLVPVQGGGSGSSSNQKPGDPSLLKPGSMISVQLVRGDMAASADGTVTMVDGGRIYAFGHPFLSAGTTELPFAESQVVTVLPNYASSMKLTTPGGFLGVIGQDRASGIAGTLGGKARTVPVDVDVVSSRGNNRSYHFEVVNDRFLLPFLVNLTSFSAIGATERSIGDSTLRVGETISIAGLPSVTSESLVSGSTNSAATAAQSAATPLAYLMQSGVGPFDIQGIHLKIVSTDRRMAEELQQVWSSKREVKPGDPLELTVRLRSQDGKETLQRTKIEIPASVTPGPLTITVADGTSMDRQETWRPGKLSAPNSPQQLIRAINNSRRNNRLYVRLARVEAGFVLQGEAFPSLPPSVVRALTGDNAASANVSPTMISTIAEYEMEPVTSVVTGSKNITVMVKD